jgi:hypothetical protein
MSGIKQIFGTKGSHKNNFTFYPSRLQVIFARSGGVGT